MSRNAGNYENSDFGEISSNSAKCKISQKYANEFNITLLRLADSGKFRKIRQICQNYADEFNRYHPALLADLTNLAILAILVTSAKFRQIRQTIKSAKIMQMSLSTY